MWLLPGVRRCVNMISIKFSHVYQKMPARVFDGATKLLQVIMCDYTDLSQAFKDYDTTYPQGTYPLPRGKLIILFLLTDGQLWTTIRRWTPEKFNYYNFHVGEFVKIEKPEGNPEGG